MPRRLDQSTAFAEFVSYDWHPQEGAVYSGVGVPVLSKHGICQEVRLVSLTALRGAIDRGCSGCQGCKGRAYAAAAYTAEEAKAAALGEGFEEVDETYPGSTSLPYKLRHLKCGRIVYPQLKYLMSKNRVGSGCDLCATDQLGDKLRLSVADMASRLWTKLRIRVIDGECGSLSDLSLFCSLCKTTFTFNYTEVTRPAWRCQGCKKLARFEVKRIRAAEFGWTLRDHRTRKRGTEYFGTHRCGEQKWISVSGLGRNGEGCPTCAKRGYVHSLPGWLYLIRYPWHEALKIGISNQPITRLDKHGRKNAIEVVHLIGEVDAKVAEDAERAIKAEWKAAGLKPVETLKGVDGWTETVYEYEVCLEQVIARMDELCGVVADYLAA